MKLPCAFLSIRSKGFIFHAMQSWTMTDFMWNSSALPDYVFDEITPVASAKGSGGRIGPPEVNLNCLRAASLPMLW